jgi:hypothetical protein
LGEAGDYLTLFAGVETIDISYTDTRRLSGHLYHLYNPAVVSDLAYLVRTGQGAGRRPGLTARTAGDAVYWQVLPADDLD